MKVRARDGEKDPSTVSSDHQYDSTGARLSSSPGCDTFPSVGVLYASRFRLHRSDRIPTVGSPAPHPQVDGSCGLYSHKK